jgi:hypothetical protein
MPKKLHEQLERRADELGLTGKRRQAYIYGTMNKVEKKKQKAK